MLERVAERTPIGRAVTMDEIVGAAPFVLENGGVNGVTSPSTAAGSCSGLVFGHWPGSASDSAPHPPQRS
jgi:hypothetical protein